MVGHLAQTRGGGDARKLTGATFSLQGSARVGVSPLPSRPRVEAPRAAQARLRFRQALQAAVRSQWVGYKGSRHRQSATAHGVSTALPPRHAPRKTGPAIS